MTTCYAQPYAPAAEQKGPSLVSDQQPAGLYVHLLQKRFAPTAAGAAAVSSFLSIPATTTTGCKKQEGADIFYFLLSQSASSFLTWSTTENEVCPTRTLVSKKVWAASCLCFHCLQIHILVFVFLFPILRCENTVLSSSLGSQWLMHELFDNNSSHKLTLPHVCV